MIQTIVAKIFGTKNEREVKRLMPKVEAINALEPEMQKLSDEQLRSKTDELRAQIKERLSRDADEPGRNPVQQKQLEEERRKALHEA